MHVVQFANFMPGKSTEGNERYAVCNNAEMKPDRDLVCNLDSTSSLETQITNQYLSCSRSLCDFAIKSRPA